jgi:hypothetical protein
MTPPTPLEFFEKSFPLATFRGTLVHDYADTDDR